MLKERLVDKGIKELVIAQEKHKEEGLHLHVYVRLESHYRARGEHKTLKLGDHYPNVQATVNKKAWLIYVTKEDKEPHEEGIEVRQFLQAKQDHRRVLHKRLVSEEITLQQAIEEDPTLLKGYKRLKADLESYLRDKKAQKPDCKGSVPNPWCKYLPLKQEKKRHIWIYSYDPNKGKTTWLKDLDSKFRCSWYNYQENFQSIREGT